MKHWFGKYYLGLLFSIPFFYSIWYINEDENVLIQHHIRLNTLDAVDSLYLDCLIKLDSRIDSIEANEK